MSPRDGNDFGSRRVEGLLTRIREYETYFAKEAEAKKKPDHQGTTAYINLVKLVCSLKENDTFSGAGPEAAVAEARRIFMEEYGVEL